MIARLNLASDPFRNRALPWTVAVAVAAVSLVAIVLTLASYRTARADADASEREVVVMRSQSADLESQALAVKQNIPPEQQKTLEAAHALVSRKGFSWSQLFSDLEEALPSGVRVQRINVREVAEVGDQTRAVFELTVLGKAPTDVTGMITDMNSGPTFRATALTENQKSGRGESGYEWTLSVSYVQRRRRAAEDSARGEMGALRPSGDSLKDGGARLKLGEQTAATTSAGGRRAGLRARLGGASAAGGRGPLGVPEIAALGVAALLLLTAVLSYLFLLAPQNSRKRALEAEREELQRRVKVQQASLGEGKDTQQRVGEILTSLDRFEVDRLGQASSGSKTVIEELNRLIVRNGLRISGGVSFTQLQETAPGTEQQAPRSVADKSQRVVQSVFPGIGITLTVEGTYQSLRRFIRDIEADRQFVVIDAVELEGVTDSNSAGAAAAAQTSAAPAQGRVAPEGQPIAPQVVTPSTPSRGALVSLRLDMAAYFRRASAAAAQ